MAPADTTALSEPILALLGLFESEFSEVKFPDVDTQILAASARGVLVAAEQVSLAEAALESARSGLQEQREGLLHTAQRALAYARVYAEDSPELSRKLELIALPRLQRKGREAAAAGAVPVPVRRRGRPPRARVEGPNLFAEEAQPGRSTAL